MIRFWFAAVARKFSSGRRVQATSRPPRSGPRLRLEVLEERAVASAVSAEPGAVEAPPGAGAHGIVSGEFEAPSGGPIFAGDPGADQTHPGGDGLAELLEDLRVPEAPPADTFAGGEPAAPSPGFFGIPPPQTPAAGPRSPDPEGAEDGGSPRGPTGSPPKPGRAPAPADAGRGEGSATPVAQIRPATTPGVRSTDAPETGPVANPPRGGSAAPAVEQPRAAGQHAPPSPDAPDRPSVRTTTAAAPSRPAGTPGAAATRTEFGALPADVPDGPLLQRFVADRDQTAFTTLVRRHERLVLRVCERVLGDLHAARDVFQLTFLTLARKANTLDLRNPLAGWLYKVAYHLALRLRGAAARQRRVAERAADGRPSRGGGEPAADLEQREMCQALREELDRLPEKYRAPLVLCYLDGRTHDEAARAIGVPRGSMAKRLAEGLERLRERLLVRGFVP